MNKQNPSTMPDENRIEELLTIIQTVPSLSFHKKMEQARWRGKPEDRKTVSSNFRLRLAVVMALLLALTTLAVTPQGRVWAQEVFQFFKQVDFTTIALSEKELEWIYAPSESYDLPLVPVIIPAPPPEMASLPGCDTAEKAQSYFCQIAYAESQLGIELMEFPVNPQGLDFQSVRFDRNTKTATIGYGPYGMSLSLTQRLGNPPEQLGPWLWVPAGEVEKIKVGSFDGEYVSGSFGLPAGGDELVWSDDVDIDQRIAWSDGTTWYLLEAIIGPGTTGYMGRDQLIELAASLVEAPAIEDIQINPDSLTSLVEAEKYSGLDLKAPTLLPLGFEFSYAKYTSFNNQVYLRYDGDGYMNIYQWEGNSLDFNALSTTYENYEIVKVNDRNAFYGFVEGSSPYLFLWWREGNLNYQMYFYWRTDADHGILDKEKMIAIAESMDDINAFRSNTPKPYEYVSIYEQVLNIDIYEFSELPAGWSFRGVWADAWANCIHLSYTLTAAQVQLHISQCSTDKLFEISDVPSSAIERVKTGKNRAQYITGGYGYDSDGTLVWQPDLPLRQLRWKENGLWIQITISGNDTLLYDKEDLISIAKSLK